MIVIRMYVFVWKNGGNTQSGKICNNYNAHNCFVAFFINSFENFQWNSLNKICAERQTVL